MIGDGKRNQANSNIDPRVVFAEQARNGLGEAMCIRFGDAAVLIKALATKVIVRIPVEPE